ncbi:C1D-domain-containing protein [Sanghuangporus baumii]|uniref:Exosome complex protein n=1 Tax=Sanghuangporus baumii TaxID=108892 RepID=A0A9Q5N593_SANBA|nr:C1D-domain-containing protein [Sanghuangporus baumii]
MTSSIKKQTNKVTALSESLRELEEKLEPLFSKPLQDTLSSLDTLQQAKLQVLLPYLINDLIFIYLKTRGIDPKTHAVVSELERVKQYFEKIKDAEQSNQKRTTEIDKAAAGRFIKHAISEAKQNISTAESTSKEAGPSNSQISTSIPVRVIEKMKEREEYLRRVAEESDSEEHRLDVIDDAGEERGIKVVEKKTTEVCKETESMKLQEVTVSESPKKKRRRPIDPFGPRGEEPISTLETSGEPEPRKKNKKLTAVIDIDASTDNASRASSDADTPKEAKSKKKRSKKRSRPEETS